MLDSGDSTAVAVVVDVDVDVEEDVGSVVEVVVTVRVVVPVIAVGLTPVTASLDPLVEHEASIPAATLTRKNQRLRRARARSRHPQPRGFGVTDPSTPGRGAFWSTLGVDSDRPVAMALALSGRVVAVGPWALAARAGPTKPVSIILSPPVVAARQRVAALPVTTSPPSACCRAPGGNGRSNTRPATGTAERCRQEDVRSYVAVDGVSGGSPADGQVDAFLRVSEDLHRYIGRLTGGDRQLTEDIVQETFIAMLRYQRLHPDVDLGVGWLMTAARNRLIDAARSRQRDRARVDRHWSGARRVVPPIDDATISDDQARWLLAHLPLHERVALGLHVVDGMSTAEVAAELGRTVEATSSLLARARRHLRTLATELSDE